MLDRKFDGPSGSLSISDYVVRQRGRVPLALPSGPDLAASGFSAGVFSKESCTGHGGKDK